MEDKVFLIMPRHHGRKAVKDHMELLAELINLDTAIYRASCRIIALADQADENTLNAEYDNLRGLLANRDWIDGWT